MKGTVAMLPVTHKNPSYGTLLLTARDNTALGIESLELIGSILNSMHASIKKGTDEHSLLKVARKLTQDYSKRMDEEIRSLNKINIGFAQ